MAVTTLSNKKNLSITLHVSSANATLVIAGNTATSNIATSDEVLTGATISQIAWGNDGNSHIQVLRGANLVAVYDTSGYIDYAGNGIPLNAFPAANLTINFVGSANSYCVIELQKIGGGTSQYLVG